jgi:hypothetical protein
MATGHQALLLPLLRTHRPPLKWTLPSTLHRPTAKEGDAGKDAVGAEEL